MVAEKNDETQNIYTVFEQVTINLGDRNEQRPARFAAVFKDMDRSWQRYRYPTKELAEACICAVLTVHPTAVVRIERLRSKRSTTRRSRAGKGSNSRESSTLSRERSEVHYTREMQKTGATVKQPVRPASDEAQAALAASRKRNNTRITIALNVRANLVNARTTPQAKHWAVKDSHNSVMVSLARKRAACIRCAKYIPDNVPHVCPGSRPGPYVNALASLGVLTEE